MAEEGPQSEGFQPQIRPPTQGSVPGRGAPIPPGCETSGDSVPVSGRAGGDRGVPSRGRAQPHSLTDAPALGSSLRTPAARAPGTDKEEPDGLAPGGRLEARGGQLSRGRKCWPAPLLLCGVSPAQLAGAGGRLI